jgi:plastocyanin
MTRWLAVVSCLALGLVAAGCGGGDNNNGGGGGGGGGAAKPAKPKQKAAAGGGGGAKAAKVSMKNIQFNPKSITVAKGGTVTWTNDDTASHDVSKQSGPGPSFKSGTGNLAKGDTYKQTFKAAGTIKYQCTVHPGMTGTVTVK